MSEEKRFAVLIDADNISPFYTEEIFNQLSNIGSITYKRIYGDWSKPQLASWKEPSLSYSITPIQQYNYTTGKNSTDSSLIIDAMDILYSNKVDGFCIVSSDSDFTRLVTRLRESEMCVIGMGEEKTPQPFIKACNKFIYLGNSIHSNTSKDTKRSTAILDIESEIVSIINDSSTEDGFCALSQVGNILQKRRPDFDTRSYGFPKLHLFIKDLDICDFVERQQSENGMKHMYISLK